MSAPVTRRVDALSGEVAAPTQFFSALTEADDRVAEVERLRVEIQQLRDSVNEIGCLLQETQRSLVEARADRDHWRTKARGRRNR